jgi:Tfp pilus assembly protein PilN
MIKINLTPFEELDNPRWWVPDVAILALVIAITFGGVYFYIDSVEQQIAAKEAEKQNMITETANLQGEVSKFNDLNSKIATLDNRKNALKRITESKLVRYLPVILMENIQNLKPEKVWLTGLAFVEKKKDENAPPPPPPPPPV